MVIWFSGTGNSRAVAELLANELREEACEMLKVSCADSERYVWVCPVYSWGIPPVVMEHIRKCNLPGEHYLVLTCGDDCGLTARMWRRAIGTRGWKVRGSFSVQMPNTYVALPGFDVDKDEVRDAKLAAFPAKVKEIAAKIREGFDGDESFHGSFASMKTGLIYKPFVSSMSARKFKVDASRCISCGKCEKACPMGNVKVGTIPAWGPNCAGCFGCYHVCPVHAITYGKFTARKGQYYYPL